MHLSFYFVAPFVSKKTSKLYECIFTYCALCVYVCVCTYVCVSVLFFTKKHRIGIRDREHEVVVILFCLCILIELKLCEWTCIHALSLNKKRKTEKLTSRLRLLFSSVPGYNGTVITGLLVWGHLCLERRGCFCIVCFVFILCLAPNKRPGNTWGLNRWLLSIDWVFQKYKETQKQPKCHQLGTGII